MSGFSTSLANEIINQRLRGQSANLPGTPYFALFTADPTDNFTAGTEVSASWYQRKPTGAFAAPANGVTFNTTRVEFPPVSGSAVTITHIGIVTGSSPTDPSAKLEFSYPLSTPKTLGVNDVYVVDSATTSGDFTLTLV